ncbi:Adenylate cyclase, putative [Trichomonas vaginalis G3]|uniref:Adenylate cyclase, putative n=1 Tax=Trichomonas vaginalis (strain ATCC PRA-98 / G3) TaxID=412133 RepID=A2DF18_TRIV3|nr:guanylate cyclase protein [Trichomonas vaginalis G3]EAY21010.1 Adenylate cyclase, putative [Trichomonas vaginalis G3]KAI5519187.1 guanylate cyclase protein [Trichomonas vaginalis G3]|eukprot:XP_001581996.1 Adenylate cyclase [Trichomonas vaginalis G3]
MSSPLGIHARKHFEFICQAKISTRTKYTGTLIPLFTCTDTNYSLIMRDYTDILNMREELNLLNRSVHSLLKRLVPPYISDIMTNNHMKDVFVSHESAVAAMCLKPSQEIVSQDSDLLDDCDITQVCISIVDKVLGSYQDISRIRTFNGNFLFVTSLFNDDEKTDKVTYLLSFLEEAVAEINKYMMFKMLVSCTISYGGPIYACITGISKTMFDVLGNELTECFDNLDIVPPGKIIFTSEAYDRMKDHSISSQFIPPRQLKKKVYIMNNYLGMNFNSVSPEL